MIPDDIHNLEDVFLVMVCSVFDTDMEYCTFVHGTTELAQFLLNYDKEQYLFVHSEKICDGNKMYWNYRELLRKPERTLETGDK
jgi:hypothetical protein